MLLFAATAIEKMHAVPSKVWMNIGLAVLIFVAAIFIIRRAAEMNKVLLSVIIFVVLTVVSFNWVYSRNEPKFLTPVIDKIAPFFPSGVSPKPKKSVPLPQ